jgi:hypothetical protein
MRPGDTVIGADGTGYLVVRARDVEEEQFRWWIARSEVYLEPEDYRGPDSAEELHLCDREDGAFLALVLP